MAKVNNTERCLELLDKKKLGELKADINTRGEGDNSAVHYAA